MWIVYPHLSAHLITSPDINLGPSMCLFWHCIQHWLHKYKTSFLSSKIIFSISIWVCTFVCMWVGAWLHTHIQMSTYMCAHACQVPRMMLDTTLNCSSTFIHWSRVSQSTPELTDMASFARPASSRDPLSLISRAKIIGKILYLPTIYTGSGDHKLCSSHFLHGKHIKHWAISPAQGLKI